MHSAKVAKALGSTKNEGQLIIDTISAEIPNVMNALGQCGVDAFLNGYLIIDEVSKMRRWYKEPLEVIAELKNLKLVYNFDMIAERIPFSKRSKLVNSSRNVKIQGVGANQAKYSIVLISRYFKQIGLDVSLLNIIHDELVYRIPEDTCIPYKVMEEVEDKKTKTKKMVEVTKYKSWVGDKISELMCKGANHFLKPGFNMSVAQDILPYWTK